MTGTARPRLVHVTTTDMSLELLLGPQLEAFAAAGYDVYGASAPGRFVDALELRGVRHIPLHHATRAMALAEDARALGELVRIFRSLRPAIVHTHNPKPGVYGRVAARLARVPIVVNTVHGLYALPEDRLRKRVPVYALERFAATCSHAELVQNPEDLPVLRRLRIPESKLRLLGNGIDLTRFDIARRDETVAWARHQLGATSSEQIVIGLVGRLVREKGYGEVFAAARALRGRYPQLVFAVVGPDEPDKADAITAAERADAAAAGVRFLGERGDLERLYCGMDVYVLASYREGFPRSAMEAAAMGIPIVATNIRGCRQVVDDEHTGLLVPPRDVGALAAAIERLVEQPELRERMGKAAAAKAANEFDQQRCIDITLATYEQLSVRLPRSRA